MSSIFKNFNQNDVATTRTLLNEAIPITGSILSGTYVGNGNIKQYSHGLFTSLYDYPYLSSSANHIFDMTVGFHNSSLLSGSSANMVSKKINMYNQMAQLLMGYDVTGSIQQFDEDGNILAGGTKLKECVFFCFSRLLVKDEIKKGSFSMVLGVSSSYAAPFGSLLTITDSGAQNDFRVNSPVGEYGILSASAGGAYVASNSGSCGLIFYQAGIVVLTGSVFLGTGSVGGKLTNDAVMAFPNTSINGVLTGSSITGSVEAVRRRIQNISFNNTTELNSSIYFCRIGNNEFNYSSNPTYLSGSKIVVKNNTLDSPVSYITSVGLYSADNALLAVAKCSECLKKTPEVELIIRTRLDY